jgi:low temperature requirement protein LtrA
VTPRVAARVAPRIEVRTAHFVERHGLLLIVALGESVVVVGIGIEDVRLGPGPIGAAVLGLALAAGLWWAYFVGDEEGAERAMAPASPEDRFRLAINGYFWSFIPMLLGVVAIVAGVKLSIGDVAARLDAGPALALGGGVAVYLAREVGFRRVMRIRPVGYRTVAALVALGTVLLGINVSAVVQLIATIVTLATTFAFEARWDRFRSRGLR